MEKQEFVDRYEASRQLLAMQHDLNAFVADIKSRLYTQLFHSVNSRYVLDNVVVVTKFDTIERPYEDIVEYVIRATVFYNTNDLLVWNILKTHRSWVRLTNYDDEKSKKESESTKKTAD